MLIVSQNIHSISFSDSRKSMILKDLRQIVTCGILELTGEYVHNL